MSASDQADKATSTNQEHPFLPPVVASTHQLFNGPTYPAPPPPGGYPPPFFAYPPPQDANNDEIGQNRVPAPVQYMISFPPPGMVYVFPPQSQVPPGGFAFTPPALTKPKRKQVKMACTNCAAACKRCDEGRPCERCQKYGIGDSCRDGQRKERKKGIKRGPYKRKNKKDDGEWVPLQAAAANANANAPIPVARFSSSEGYHGPIYPTPVTFLPHPTHEIPSGQEGSVPANGPPPIMPYFLSAYSPYPPPYGHPAFYPGMPPWAPQYPGPPQIPQLVQPQQTVQQSASRALDASTGGGEIPSPGPKKKVEGLFPVNGNDQTENAASSATSSVLNGTATSKKRSCRVNDEYHVEEECWMESDCEACPLDPFAPFLSISHSPHYL